MIIHFKRAFGIPGITIAERKNEIPMFTCGSYELVEGLDYTIEEKEKEGITAIVFEWMDNQHVYFQK